MTRWTAFTALVLATIALGAGPACADSLVEFSGETQMQLDFHVPDAALAAMLPAGWEPSVATPGQGCQPAHGVHRP